MSLCPFVIAALFLLWGFDLYAEVPAGPVSMPEEWQLTLDVIKSKAQTLMVENNGLKGQYHQLSQEAQKLQRSLDAQQAQNEKTERLLEERHGRTDQQARLEQLTRTLKAKRQQARGLEEQLRLLSKRRQAGPKNVAPATEQIEDLRKQLEDATKEEVLLENQLNGLKENGGAQNPDTDKINEENKALEARLDALRLKQLSLSGTSDAAAKANQEAFTQLTERKSQLEEGISVYERRLDKLRESLMMSLSWPLTKKKLIHEVVQTDARNNQIRNKIKQLREDIEVLRDQVARLEHRLDFVRGSS